MFKKFKDKLAEEMKQSPARLQASMQQLAQAVVSPALSSSSIQDLSASNDNFSLTEEGDETPKNSPARHGFQNVDLTSHSSNSMGVSRRSSVSSVTSDASSLFPIYESPGNMFHLQSDIEQSASEVEDSTNFQLDRISKDQLYSAYRKIQTKYHKYRGRYTDLASHYREMERVKGKLEALLVETQDKALRRIADLKEQCQLEQQAKAHLEEALRNDIEEKDHVINTLNTKVKLLQSNGMDMENLIASDAKDQNQKRSAELLIDLSNEPALKSNENLLTENVQLKEKLKKLENLVAKCKESLKRNKEKISELTQEKNILERDFDVLKNSNTDRFKLLEGDLNVAREEIVKLGEQISILKKREEESVISLAENKLSVHRELEVKEEQIKQLRLDLKQTMELKENLSETVDRYREELEKLKLIYDNQNFDIEKNDLIQDLSKGKSEALKLMQREMQQKVIDLEEKMGTRYREEVERNKELLEKLEKFEKGTGLENVESTEKLKFDLKKKESELSDLREKFNELEKISKEHESTREKLEVELTNLKVRYEELKIEHKDLKHVEETRQKQAVITSEEPQDTDNYLLVEQEKLRKRLLERDEICEQLNTTIQEHTVAFESAKQKLLAQDAEIKSLREKIEDDDKVNKLQDELENKSVELLGLTSELKSCKSTINDLKEKIKRESSKINLLGKEKACLITNILDHRKIIRLLKEDCENLKKNINESVLYQKNAISTINQEILNIVSSEEFTSVQSTNENLMKQLKALEDKNLKLENDLTSLKSDGTQIEIWKKENLELSNELKSLRDKVARLDNLEQNNNKLERQVEQLNASLQDYNNVAAKYKEMESELTKTIHLKSVLEKERKEYINQVAEMMEKVNRFDELELKNSKLIAEIDNFNFKMFDVEKLQKEKESMLSEIEILNENSKKYHDLSTENRQLNDEINELKRKISDTESAVQQLEELKKKYEESTNLLELAKSETGDYHMLTQEIQTLKSEVGNLTDKCCKKDNKLKSLNEKYTKEKCIVTDLRKQIEELTEKSAKLDANHRKLDELNMKLTSELKESNEMLQEITNENSRLTENCRVLKVEQSNTIQSMNNKLEELKSENTKILKQLEISENTTHESLKVKMNEIETLTNHNVELINEVQCLKTENREIETLRNNCAAIVSELEQLKTMNNEINLENKELKDKQNELLKSNEELQHSKNVMNEKIAEFEKNTVQLLNEIAVLHNEIELYKVNQTDQNTEIDHLREQLIDFNKVQSKNMELSVEVKELSAEVFELRTKLNDENVIHEKNAELLVEIESLQAKLNTLESMEVKYIQLNSEIEILRHKLLDFEAMKLKNDELIVQLENYKAHIATIENINLENVKLESQLEDLKLKLQNMEFENSELNAKLDSFTENDLKNVELSSEISNLKEKNTDLSTEIENLKVLANDKVRELKVLDTRNTELLHEIEKLNLTSSETIQQKVREIEVLQNETNEFEKRLNEKEREINLLKETNGKLYEQLEREHESETINKTLMGNKDKLEGENKKLEAQLDEALITFQAKESQMQIANNELKNRADKLETELKTNEEEQNMRLKQLVKEFQAQLHDKDEQIQAAIEKRFDHQQNYESDLIQQYKEQLKDFQVELTAKSEQMENLILENKEITVQKQKEMDKLSETIAQIKKEHANELRDVEKKWKVIVKQKTDQLEAKHGHEVDELTREWRNERRINHNSINSSQTEAKSETSTEELESTSRVAMAAVQSNTGSLHTLQQTLVSQRRELAELRKLVSLRHDTLEDSTEIEYLRNILFEYMMGTETVVLARVIAAVVKFDQEQTSKILKKEQDKLTLLGSLGLS